MGNLNARRDWGFAGDYVEAMRMMLQADEPCDYVVATGMITPSSTSSKSPSATSISITENFVRIDQALIRPAEVDYLCGDATKARKAFGWEPKVTFEQMIKMMVESDLDHNRLYPNAVHPLAGM